MLRLDRGDLAAGERDVAPLVHAAGGVDHGAALDQQVVRTLGHLDALPA